MPELPTLDYLADAQRRGAVGNGRVDPLKCRCEVCDKTGHLSSQRGYRVRSTPRWPWRRLEATSG